MWKLRPRRVRPRLYDAPGRRRAPRKGVDEAGGPTLQEAARLAARTHAPVASTSKAAFKMPEPVEDLIETPEELALEAAFADKRAMLELTGFASKGIWRMPRTRLWHRRSASMEANPYPVGFDSEQNVPVGEPWTESDPHVGSWVGLPSPQNQSSILGLYDPSLPESVQSYLASRQAFHVEEQPKQTSPASKRDIEAIAPFGVADDSAFLPKRRTPSIFAESQSRLFLSHHETRALWKASLLHLRNEGQLSTERLEALAQGFRTAQAMRTKAGAPLAIIFGDIDPGLPSVRPKRKAGRTAKKATAAQTSEEVADEEAAGVPPASELIETIQQVLRVAAKSNPLLRHLFGSRASAHVQFFPADGGSSTEQLLNFIFNGDEVQEQNESRPAAAKLSAQGLVDDFYKARRGLLKKSAKAIEQLGTLDEKTRMPDRAPDKLRRPLRSLQHRLVYLYARYEAMARGLVEDSGSNAAVLEVLIKTTALRMPSAEDEDELSALVEEAASVESQQIAWDDLMCVRLLRANLSGASSLRGQRAEPRRRNAAIQLLSTSDWRRHKHKKHKQKKKEKRGQTDREIADRRARRERIRQYQDSKHKSD